MSCPETIYRRLAVLRTGQSVDEGVQVLFIDPDHAGIYEGRDRREGTFGPAHVKRSGLVAVQVIEHFQTDEAHGERPLHYGSLDEALANPFESFGVVVHGNKCFTRDASCAQCLRYALATQRIQAHEV